MNSGIVTICIVAGYLASFLAELPRFFVPGGGRPTIPRTFFVLAFLVQSAFLVSRVLAADGQPLSSPFDWLMVASWMMAVAYLYELLHQPQTAIAVYFLPLILILIGSAQFADKTPFDKPQA
jgi:hypothetical protein